MPDVYLYPGEANPNDVRLRPAFDPAVYHAVRQLTDSVRNVRLLSLTAGDDAALLGGFFKPETVPWWIPCERVASSIRYRYEVPRDFTPIQFVPNTQAWWLDSVRMGTGVRYQRDTHRDTAWSYQAVPVIFDPSGQPWTIDSQRNIRRQLLTAGDDETFLGGFFDPKTVPWHIESRRVEAPAWWPSDQPDAAWITPNLVVAPPFDAALFPAIAELVGHRTPRQASLVLQGGSYVFDLSFVHDVLGLTDPVPSALIKLRPIAPIMNRRRQRRRR